MTRKTFPTIAATVALAIGLIAALASGFLLHDLKAAVPNPPAPVMARTAGVLLIAVGIQTLLVRGHRDSPTMRAVLSGGAALQLMLLPADPLAYVSGAFGSVAAFLPNTAIHLLLLGGFVYFARHLRPTAPPEI